MNRRGFFQSIGLAGCALNSGTCLSGASDGVHLQVQSLALSHSGTQKMLSIRLVSIVAPQGNRTQADTAVGPIETHLSELDALNQLFANAPTIARIELPVKRSGHNASSSLQTTISRIVSQTFRDSLNRADLVLFIPSDSGVIAMPLYTFVENVAQKLGTPLVSLVTQTMFFDESECFIVRDSIREVCEAHPYRPTEMQTQAVDFRVQRFPREQCLRNVAQMFSEMCMRMTDMFNNVATVVHGVRDIKLYLGQLAEVSRVREPANSSTQATITTPYEIDPYGYHISRNGQDGSRIRAYLEVSKTDRINRSWDLREHLRCFSPKGAVVTRSGCVYCDRDVMDGTVQIHKFEGRYIRSALTGV